MPIPAEHKYRSIYHFTHIDNLPTLLEKGFLCNNHPDFPDHCLSIAESGIQARRAAMKVTCGPYGTVHDYVPLYFGSLSPMLLAVVNKKNVDQCDILYFEFPISLLDRDDVIFTDSSANAAIPPQFYSDPVDLVELNWTAIDSLKWGGEKQQRMAEVLVHSTLALAEANRVIVWNEQAKKRVEEIVAKSGCPFPSIGFEDSNRRHYFAHFVDKEKKGQSIVTGPRGIAQAYNQACEFVKADVGSEVLPGAFDTPRVLLHALQKDFGCLPHTSELIGLRSENGLHQKTVDVHTLEVVENLRSLAAFEALPENIQSRVELAAFLHDIGKGPRARWANNGGLQKVDPDHAVGAMPMMAEILTRYVVKVKRESAELILKLVCYHDLVGEVMGKGRDERQIVDTATSKLELDALFMLSRADVTALRDEWWDESRASALYDRCWSAIQARRTGPSVF